MLGFRVDDKTLVHTPYYSSRIRDALVRTHKPTDHQYHAGRSYMPGFRVQGTPPSIATPSGIGPLAQIS